MQLARARLAALLDRVCATLRARYAQWVEEDSDTYDYRVLCARVPEGSVGYEIAHRTGVIGQVFRTGRSILVADTRTHPLYDPFDAAVAWELAIPVLRDEVLAAVLNLEGRGAGSRIIGRWNGIAKAVADETGCRIPSSPPVASADVLMRTKRLFLDNATELLTAARVKVHGGRCVLVIAPFCEASRLDHPTIRDAALHMVPLAECIYGVETHLDLLCSGENDSGLDTFARLRGWALVEGRYDFVLALK